MKTNSLFLVLSFSLILLFTANEMSAQIYSTSNGGNWHNPQTWIGGTIPDGSNSVVITSVVSVDNTAFCNNLTVQPNGTLQNTGGSHTINVYGHASNSGIIQNYVNSLIMYVHGNITNSGVWSIHNTCLSGSADQTVGTYGGHIFTGANFTDNEVSSQVIADTDLVFDGTHIDLNFSNLILPAGYRISVSGSGVAFRDANIYGDNSILEMSAGTKIYFINGYNLIMQGTISIDDNNSHFHNYLINQGTIQNIGGSHSLSINGDFTNNGIVLNNVSFLTLYINGDIVNNGTWSNHSTILNGTSDQELSCLGTNYFSGSNFLDYEISSQIIGLSDLTFVGTNIDLDISTLVLNSGSTLSVTGSGITFRDAIVIGNNSVLEMSSGSQIQNIEISDITLQGILSIGDNDSHFYGTTISNATIQNTGGSHSLAIHGDFTNNGTILNAVSFLTIYIAGDIVNNGGWSNHSTVLNGTSTQNLTFSQGIVYTGANVSVNNLHTINALSDINFSGTNLDFNYNTLNLPANSRFTTTGDNLFMRDITIEGNYSELLMRGNHFQNATINNIVMRGLARVGDSNSSLNGKTVLLDTLDNHSSSHTLYINGDFENYGTIKNSVNYLTIHLNGDIVNHGFWDNYETRLTGQYWQEINFGPGIVFTGNNFINNNSSNDINVTSDIAFNNTNIDFNYANVTLPQNANISIEGNVYFRDGNLYANGAELYMTNGAQLANWNIYNIIISGVIQIGDSNIDFYTNAVNNGTIQNVGSSHSVNFHGSFTNNGNILNSVNFLSLFFQDDLINGGSIECHEVRISGYNDQHIRLIEDATINSNVNIYSNIAGYNYQWYVNGGVIPGASSGTLNINPLSSYNYGTLFCTTSTEVSRTITIQKAMQADFIANPASGSAPLTVNFTDNSISNFLITSWYWEFGDGSFSTSQNPTHIYTSPGYYTVILTISDSYVQNTEIKDKFIYVCTTPNVDFIFSDICFQDSTIFTDLSTSVNHFDSNIVQYASSVIDFSTEWDPIICGSQQILGQADVYPVYGDHEEAWTNSTPNGQREFIELGFAQAMPINAVWIYETLYPGTVDTVYVKNPNSGLWEIVWSGTASMQAQEARIFEVEFPVTAFDVSEIRIATNPFVTPYWSEIDAVAIVSLVGQFPYETVSYEWDIENDGIVHYTNAGDIKHLFATEGWHQVSLTVTNDGLCEDEIVKDVYISNPVVELGPDTTVCAGETVILDAGSGFESYFWSTGETTQSISVTPFISTNKMVEVTDSYGCIAFDYRVIYVNQLPSVSFSGLAANYCEDHQAVTLIGNPAGGVFSGSGILGNNFNPSLASVGIHDISYSYTNLNGCKNSEIQTTEVFALPIIFIGNDTNISTIETMLFDAGANFDEYLWSDGSTTQTIIIDGSILGAGIFDYSVSVTNLNSCVTNDSISIEVIGDSTYSQTINLSTGWSLFSTYIYPDYPNISDVLSLIVNDITIVKNENGGVYWPVYGINVIGDLTIGKAYIIKMLNSNTLTITGTAAIPEVTPINLQVGWRYLGYLRQAPASIVIMLSSIDGTFEIVKDDVGNVYWPLYGINVIGNLEPGKGYQIKMNTTTSLTYPANTANFSKSSIQILQPKHFKEIQNTGSNMTLGIPKTAWETEPLIGSEIGIFSDSKNYREGKLVGSSVYTGKNLAISIWGDDGYSQEIDGMIGKENFTIKIWNGNSVDVVEIESWLEGDEFYKTNKISIVEKLSIVNYQLSIIKLFQNAPNPFYQTTKISFYIPEKAFVEIELFNLIGEKIQTVDAKNYPAGNQSIIFDRKNLSSGVYFYKLTSNEFAETKIMNIE